MNFYIIIFIFNLIIKVYCGVFTSLNEAVSLLIIAVGNDDGTITLSHRNLYYFYSSDGFFVKVGKISNHCLDLRNKTNNSK